MQVQHIYKAELINPKREVVSETMRVINRLIEKENSKNLRQIIQMNIWIFGVFFFFWRLTRFKFEDHLYFYCPYERRFLERLITAGRGVNAICMNRAAVVPHGQLVAPQGPIAPCQGGQRAVWALVWAPRLSKEREQGGREETTT